MEEFTIILNGVIFKLKKNMHNFYKVTPFDENISVNDLSNALIIRNQSKILKKMGM